MNRTPPSHARWKFWFGLLGACIAVGGACRVERIEGDAAGEPPLRRETPASGAVEPEALVVAPAASGPLPDEARVALCAALAGGADREAELARALNRLECALRASGRAATESAFVAPTRWGAASGVPSEYLASEVAFDRFMHGTGMQFGRATMQPLAPCPLPSATATDAATPEPVPEPVPEPDADAGTESAGATPSPEPQAEGSSSPALVAVLLRDAHGEFRAAIALALPDGSAPANLHGQLAGLEALPGQRILAGDDGVVLSLPRWPRDLARAPAPAATAYAALEGGRSPDGAATALSRDGRHIGDAPGLSITRLSPEACGALAPGGSP